MRAGIAALARDLGLGALIGTLCLLVMGSPLLPGQRVADAIVPLVYNVLQFGIPLVFALRAADRAIARGWPRGPTYAAAAIGVTLGGVWVIGPLLMPVLGSDPDWNLLSDFWLAFGVGLFLALGTAGYAQWRASQQALERALAAETDRVRHAQQLQAARLLALQARVEPQLLFDALTRIEQRLPADAAAAERQLDDLIVLLRLLLPTSGSTASTLARELALLAALAQVQGLPAWITELPEALAQAPCPPQLLADLQRQLAGAPQPWRVTAARDDGGRVRIEVAGPPDTATSAALQALRTDALHERLQQLHGEHASLVVRPHAHQLVLTLPDGAPP